MFIRQAAQGDLLIIRAAALPDGLTEVAPESGQHVLAHSETGHHHVIEAERDGELVARLLTDPEDPLSAWLDVRIEADVTHLRPTDAHAPIALPPGVYHLRRQREYSPKGWRRAVD